MAERLWVVLVTCGGNVGDCPGALHGRFAAWAYAASSAGGRFVAGIGPRVLGSLVGLLCLVFVLGMLGGVHDGDGDLDARVDVWVDVDWRGRWFVSGCWWGGLRNACLVVVGPSTVRRFGL